MMCGNAGKRVIVFLLWGAFFLYQGTRQIVGAALPQIQQSFGVAPTAIGSVVTVFALTYGICVPLAGIAADLFNRRWLIVLGVATFSIGIFFSGFACGVGALLLTYGILAGCGESFFYPGMVTFLKSISRDSFSTAFAIVQGGSYAGVIVISSIAGYFAGASDHGWRIPFLLFGGIGVAWSLILWLTLKPSQPEMEAPPPPEKREKVAFWDTLRAIVAKPTAICATLAMVMMLYVDFGFKTWMPAFLQKHFGCSVAYAAFSIVLWHYLGAFFGVQLGGRLADRFVKRDCGIRLVVCLAGLLFGVPFIIAMAYLPNVTLCIVAMTLFGFARGVFDSNIYASLFDVIDSRFHAFATGLMLASAFILSSAAPVVVGLMFERFSMCFGIASLSLFYLAGSVVLLIGRLFFIRRDYCGK